MSTPTDSASALRAGTRADRALFRLFLRGLGRHGPRRAASTPALPLDALREALGSLALDDYACRREEGAARRRLRHAVRARARRAASGSGRGRSMRTRTPHRMHAHGHEHGHHATTSVSRTTHARLRQRYVGKQPRPYERTRIARSPRSSADRAFGAVGVGTGAGGGAVPPAGRSRSGDSRRAARARAPARGRRPRLDRRHRRRRVRHRVVRRRPHRRLADERRQRDVDCAHGTLPGAGAGDRAPAAGRARSIRPGRRWS